MRSTLRCAISLIIIASAGVALAADKTRVVVWDERQPKQKTAYKNFLGNQIAGYLQSRPGLHVTSVGLPDPEKGLGPKVLDACDVLVWWGHVRQQEITPEQGKDIVRRIKTGKLSLLTLHSAHWSTPFVEAMYERSRQDALGELSAEQREKAELKEIYPKPFRAPKYGDPATPSTISEKAADGHTIVTLKLPNCCFPLYRVADESSSFRTVAPDHPIARGVPARFTIARTEVYDEPFHVPEPDAVVFEERWESGERFRNAMIWKLGKGHVIYLRPGHETYPIFKQPAMLKIIENSIRWMAEPTDDES